MIKKVDFIEYDDDLNILSTITADHGNNEAPIGIEIPGASDGEWFSEKDAKKIIDCLQAALKELS